jgi:SOS-response transcriptional repressor LexA
MVELIFLPLSDRQKSVLRVVVASLDVKHYPPTIQEIQEGAGLGNPGLVFKVLTALEDKGYIIRTKGKHRSVRITELGTAYLESARQLSLEI